MKIKAFVHAEKRILEKGHEYKLYPFSTAIAGSVVVCQVEVDVEIPEGFDPSSKEKEAKRKELQNQLEAAKFMVRSIETKLEAL
jgi:hypothetical protein